MNVTVSLLTTVVSRMRHICSIFCNQLIYWFKLFYPLRPRFHESLLGQSSVSKWHHATFLCFSVRYMTIRAACGSVVVWDTMLQDLRSRVRFPMRSLHFSIYIILPAALWPLGSTQPLTETSTTNLPGGERGPALEVDKLSPPSLGNVGFSTSHNPMVLHVLLQG
jgi:hypothetical protein